MPGTFIELQGIKMRSSFLPVYNLEIKKHDGIANYKNA